MGLMYLCCYSLTGIENSEMTLIYALDENTFIYPANTVLLIILIHTFHSQCLHNSYYLKFFVLFFFSVQALSEVKIKIFIVSEIS